MIFQEEEKTLKSLALSCLLSIGVATGAFAQSYPSKPIRLIVPFPPGGGNDVAGRIVAQRLTERLGQQVVVENRAGANGIVGLQALMQSPPDGYTVGVGAAGPLAVNPSIYAKLPYDSLKDFTPLTNVAVFPLLLVAHSSLPVKNLSELIVLAKAEPSRLNYASPGAGNSGHLAGELLNHMAGVRITHVPYKGQGPAVTDLLAGQVQLLWSSIPSVIGHVQSGKLRAIAIGSARRLESLPDIPTAAESGLPGYEAYSWVGLIGPARMPPEVVGRLNREVVDIVRTPDFAEQLLKQGAVPDATTPEQFAAYIRSEIEKWGAVVKAAGIKAE
jgi:tripartite-type tricarboxylate transporter receptor subunit TctC